MKTILAPIDFSSVTESVVKQAVTLARGIEARVVLLSIVQPPNTVAEFGAMVDLEEVTALWQKNAARRLERVAQEIRNDFVHVQTQLITGSSPVEHIVMQAEELDPCYIVMGSHGHGAVYDLLVGSTTHGVLNRVRCPVAIVPAAKDTAKSEKSESPRQPLE